MIESFNSEMSRKGLITKTQVILFKEDTVNKEIANNLNLIEGEIVYKIIRLRFIEQSPTVIVTTYVPKSIVPQLNDVDFRENSLYATLEEFDFPVEKILRRLEVIKSDEMTSHLLGIEKGDPILYFHSTGYTKIIYVNNATIKTG